jgi:carboxypeptidase Taq
VASGGEPQRRHWLGRRVWPLGRSVNGEELVAQVSGRPLSAAPFLAWLSRKLEALLGCARPAA